MPPVALNKGRATLSKLPHPRSRGFPIACQSTFRIVASRPGSRCRLRRHSAHGHPATAAYLNPSSGSHRNPDSLPYAGRSRHGLSGYSGNRSGLTHGYPGADANASAHRNAVANPYINPGSDTDFYADAHAYPHANPGADGDANPNTYPDAYGNA